MKKCFIFLSIIIMTSCNSDKKPESNQSFEKILPKNKPDKIIGQWTIHEMTSRTFTLTYTSDERINFNNNNTASLIAFPNKIRCNYSWSIKADTLTLQITDSNKIQSPFIGVKFRITYRDEKDYTMLKLEGDSSLIYVLYSGRDVYLY